MNSVDEALDKCIGPIGHWQIRVSILMALVKFPIAWFQLGIVFLAPPTSFWCRRPPQYANVTIHDWLQQINPNSNNHTMLSEQGSCYMLDPSPNNNRTESLSSVPCVWGYEYDTSQVRASIVTEWHLVCNRVRLLDVAQASLMFGILLGTIIFGIASDRFGRKPVLMVCLVVQTLAGALTAFAPTYWMFVLARFVLAFANGGTMVASFVICMEAVGGKWRTIIPILYQIPFGLGNSAMAVIAYFVRDWRHLQLILSVLSAGYLLYWHCVPESPRWLLATGRHDDALRVLSQIAIENHKPVSVVKTVMESLRNVSNNSTSTSSNNNNISALFRTPVIRRKSVVLCLHWLCTGVTFYGFSQYIGQVSRQLYVTVALSGLVALPGTTLCCAVVPRYGRRRSILGAHVFTALCYVAISLVPVGLFAGDWPRVALAGLGIAGMSVSIPALYLFTGELFPTVLRNAGLGATVMCSRVGSMLAPFLISLSTVATWLPLVLLGSLVLLEAVLVLPLPETKDTVLPDTVPDAEAFVGHKKRIANDALNANYLMVPRDEPSFPIA